jgi:hypothetical protein
MAVMAKLGGEFVMDIGASVYVPGYANTKVPATQRVLFLNPIGWNYLQRWQQRFLAKDFQKDH